VLAAVICSAGDGDENRRGTRLIDAPPALTKNELWNVLLRSEGEEEFCTSTVFFLLSLLHLLHLLLSQTEAQKRKHKKET
jgi:hypothetical protein